MLYKALGFAVWQGAKWYLGRKLPPARLLAGVGLAAVAATAVAVGAKLFLRRKYGPTYAPKPLVAGGLLVALIGVLLLAKSREDNS